MKNIFVFDLDGTIILENKRLNEFILKKLIELQRNGHEVVFATSRSLRGIRAVLQPELLSNPLILCNGSFSIINNEIAVSKYVDKEECTNLVCYLEKNDIQFYLELGNELYIPSYGTHPFFEILLKEAYNEVVHSKFDNIDSKVYKIAVVDSLSTDIINDLLSIVNKSRIYQHSDGSVDIVASDCSKWKMLQELRLSSSATRLIAFGNDSNDIEMIKNADIGVAVCPLNETLDKAADIKINDYSPDSIIKQIDQILC